MSKTEPTNQQISELLDQIADLLETKAANPHRIRAYRQAASSIRESDEPVAQRYKAGGQDELQSIPGIGETISRIIKEYIKTGKSRMLQKLLGEISPEELFTRVPGIGRELSSRIVNQLRIHTLAELELAAHEGKLNQVEGFGERRIDAVKNSLAGMLNPSALRRMDEVVDEQEDRSESRPPVSLILEIDKEYRQRSEAGTLRMIAPKRFNPENIA